MASKQDRQAENEKIVTEAKERFTRCEEWESDSRRKFVEDLKFANGDPDNGWQWDAAIITNRVNDDKPCLTINKTRQHNLIITNDAKQNKPGVNIKPVGDGASYDAAQVFEGVVRHIEYQSSAEQAYDTASMFQVQGGIGYWRIVTDYVSDESFDQEIYIRRVKNPLAVYLDPDIAELDGSDARFGFVFEDVDAEQFKKEYPDQSEYLASTSFGIEGCWGGKDKVRICEYYRMEDKKDRLLAFSIPEGYEQAGQQIIVRESQMTDDQKAVYELVKDVKDAVTSRDIVTDEIMWYKIAGDRVVDSRPWPGKYIPIVRIVGEETVIEGKLDRKGHTRAMKDAQRMYNYWASEATAQVALQTKTPYVAPAEAIENYESYWQQANTSNAAVLPYNALSDNGKEIPRPQREQPPQMASAYMQGMQICENQMMMSSGQYQSQFGQNENATSGRAINERQRQGDTATYHFIDGLSVGIRFTGVILVDLIPKIYDTERVIRILAKDGTENDIQIDPKATDAYQQTPQAGPKEAKEANSVAAIFNPNVGRYEVESDVGPGYATRRQEAFNAMTQIAAQNDKFMEIAGDLMWRSADFPLADELAERWSRIIPKNITGEGPPPEIQQMTQMIKHLQDTIVELNKKLTDKDADLNVKEYDATTRRISAIGNSGPTITPEQIQPVLMQLLQQMLSSGGPEEPQAGFEQPPEPQPMMQPQGMM
ncbi:portal protein [Rhizobium puerariae]|uniref:Portal protein n=1 Tax=Rhizobium puerariae TaxID=1585791 RepID=A0ABV6AN44_9HYPH